MTNLLTGLLGRARRRLARRLTAVTPLWVTLVAVGVAALGPVLAWQAGNSTRDRIADEAIARATDDCRNANQRRIDIATGVRQAEQLGTTNDIEATEALLVEVGTDPDVIAKYRAARERGLDATLKVLDELIASVKPSDCDGDGQRSPGDFP